MKKKLFAAIGATTLILAGCSGTTEVKQVGPSTGTTQEPLIEAVAIDAPMPAIPAGLESYYEQDINESDCDMGLKCGTIEVPLDYNNPDAASIEIAYAKRPASGESIGALLVNPGGPGGTGQDMAAYAQYYFSKDILASFDIIGFDPRGVGESAPVSCVDDDVLSDLLEASYPDTPEGEAQEKADADLLIAGCEERSGDLLHFIGTEEAARDMDVLRHVFGDPQLYYVGFSYGTKLGGMYAELYPENVGRLVLDGAVDSAISNFEQDLTQIQGFELALDNYLTDCLASTDCPFDGTIDDARAEIDAMLADSLENPLPTDDPDRMLTQSGLMIGIITPLYDDMSWPMLSDAFEEVKEDGTGSDFLQLFDWYTGRNPDGSYEDNSNEAIIAINCADAVIEGDEEIWKEQSDQMAQEAPLFGKYMGYSGYMCQNWPRDGREVITEFNAVGSAPIVVVGTVGDPATPYEWSIAFADDFDNAVLVTWEGEGHTAYGRAGDCINDALDLYLLTGQVPEDGLTCGADE
ncbi:MAG: alpha/beta hydrolase [Actinomycetaceae bacterium]|nr:alpha/beta hydrolase [Actinomycetaceae bacterium]